MATYQDFFSDNYKRKAIVFLSKGNIPGNRLFQINFKDIKEYDEKVSKAVIENPSYFLDATKNLMNRIDKDANWFDIEIIDFEDKYSLSEVSSNDLYHLISMDVAVVNINKIKPMISKAIFECKACLRQLEINQSEKDVFIEPSMCTDCGGNSFRILHDESKFKDYQEVIIEGTDRKKDRQIKAKLIGNIVKFGAINRGDFLNVTGYLIPGGNLKSKVFDEFIFIINSFKKIENINNDKEFVLSSEFKETMNRSKIKPTSEYTKWRLTVLEMSSFTCAKCKEDFEGPSDKLHAHHIENYSDNENLRLDPDNGIALCVDCHRIFHKMFGKSNIGQRELDLFLGNEWLN